MKASVARELRRKRLGTIIPRLQVESAELVQKVISGQHADSTLPWKEASTQVRSALILVQGAMAAQRAETLADGPKTLAVVVLPPRIENARDWEAARPRAIEATAVPVLPPKEPDAA